MEKHADKGRLLVAEAILLNERIGNFDLIKNALNCIFAYDDSINPKLKKIIKKIKDEQRT